MSLGSRFLGLLVLALGLVGLSAPTYADNTPHAQLKEHVRDVVQKVKTAPTAKKKRALLNDEIRSLVSVLDRAATLTASSRDQSSIEALRSRLQEKIDELNGRADYEAVPNRQLDAFADYVQQDLEQADNTIVLSTTSALLILLLIILLV